MQIDLYSRSDSFSWYQRLRQRGKERRKKRAERGEVKKKIERERKGGRKERVGREKEMGEKRNKKHRKNKGEERYFLLILFYLPSVAVVLFVWLVS